MNEHKLMRALGLAKKKYEEQHPVKEGLFGKDWYLSSWFEKIIFLLSFVALFYSIIRIIIQGWW